MLINLSVRTLFREVPLLNPMSGQKRVALTPISDELKKILDSLDFENTLNLQIRSASTSDVECQV